MNKGILKITVICLCLLMGTGFTAEAKDNDAKKQEKAEKKRLKAIQDSIDFALAKAALEDSSFVLKAYQLTLPGSKTIYPDANTNFIALQKGKATLQIASDSGYVGPNGLGGITVEGTISNVKTWTDKKGNYFMEYTVNGLAISARIDIKLHSGGNKATINVYPNFNSSNLRMYGNIVSYDSANIFQGRSI